MNPLEILNGIKTYLGAAILMAAGGFMLSQGQGELGTSLIGAGLGVAGIGHKAEKLTNAVKALNETTAKAGGVSPASTEAPES